MGSLADMSMLHIFRHDPVTTERVIRRAMRWFARIIIRRPFLCIERRWRHSLTPPEMVDVVASSALPILAVHKPPRVGLLARQTGARVWANLVLVSPP